MRAETSQIARAVANMMRPREGLDLTQVKFSSGARLQVDDRLGLEFSIPQKEVTAEFKAPCPKH